MATDWKMYTLAARMVKAAVYTFSKKMGSLYKSHSTHFAGGGFNNEGALEVRARTRWSALRPYSFALLVAQLDAEQRGLRFAHAFCFAATCCVRVVRIQRQMGRRKEVADLLEQCKNVAHGDSRLVTAFDRVFP